MGARRAVGSEAFRAKRADFQSAGDLAFGAMRDIDEGQYVVPFFKGVGEKGRDWADIFGGHPFSCCPMPFESEPDARCGVVVEQLGITGVAGGPR
jgi:hypothetical protein